MKLFPKKNSVQLIPPTQAALEQHMRRAGFQGGPSEAKPWIHDPTYWVMNTDG